MAPVRKALLILLGAATSAALVDPVLRPADAQAQQQQLQSSPTPAPAGGGTTAAPASHGGHAGHGSGVVSDPDVQLVLAQMQGHLLIAQELLLQRRFSDAEPHAGHPVEELYGSLDPVLRSGRIRPFLSSLEELRLQIRLNPAAPATASKLTAAQQAIATASRSISAGQPMTAATLRNVVRQLADVAVEEYQGAVAGDQVVELIEYQDARGFLLQAQRLLRAAIAVPPPAGPGPAAGAIPSWSAMEQTITAMLVAFPSATPPARTVLGVAQLRELKRRL
jgi:hypothetical protein